MNAKLLVVEDSTAQRFLVTKILEESGFTVLGSEDGKDALNKIPDFQPDVVISDIMMPEMDGITLSIKMKEEARWKDIPVVLMTTLNEPLEILRIINSRADYLYLKEFNPDAFVLFIEDILKTRAFKQSQQGDSVVLSYFKEIQKIKTSQEQAVHLLFSTYRSALQAYDRYYRLKHDLQEVQNSIKKQLKENDQNHQYRYTQINLLLEEIRTPLNNLFNIFELLQNTEAKQEHEVYLQLATINSKNISKALDDLQTIAHFKSKFEQIPAQFIHFNLRECVDDALSPFVVQAGKKQIELILHLAQDVPEFVKGEPNYLRHILFILIDNACRFTEQGSIVVKAVKTDQQGKKFRLKFVVKDSGKGLSAKKEAELKKLFEEAANPARPVSSKLQEKNPGLFVAARLISTLKGEIGFNSGKDGTEFFFSVHLEEGEAPPEIIRLKTSTNLKNLSVLILTEQWLNGVVLEELLESWGAKVEITNDSSTVIERLVDAYRSKHPYRLFILDGSIQGISAFKILEKMLHYKELSNLKKILLTSFGKRGDAVRCIEYGVSAFLLKPVQAKELYQTIQTVMQIDPDSKVLITRHTIKESARPLRVLVAEDNRVNQKLMMSVLTKDGFEVDLVSNGLEAVNVYKQKPIDIILMDMQMPVMDGFQATREIRKLDAAANKHTIIFALTASEDPKEIQGAINAGVDEVMRKPLNLPAFKDILEKYLKNEKKLVVEG